LTVSPVRARQFNNQLNNLFRFSISLVTRARPALPQRMLSIGELASRTGLTPAVLRSWEARHGFPVPQRGASGHRRYRESDVDLVRRVLHLQRAGVRLEAAIREVTASRSTPTLSVFAMLRSDHPHLSPQRLRKPTLLALSRSIEDEYLAAAEPGVVCGSFQRERFYHASRARWSELARRSRWSMAFADFPEVRDPEPDESARVPLSREAPMRREWAVVAESPRLCVCLAGWETPGQDDVPDRHRTFEVVWTIDPHATRQALRTCAEVANAAGLAQAPDLLNELDAHPVVGETDPTQASALLNRAIGYVDRAITWSGRDISSSASSSRVAGAETYAR
jgi:MerR family transcriptional regulator, light-induced transcriptional regulator